MADLASIRKAHPEYNDLSDQQLSDALYAKFYSDMPRADFDARMASPQLGPSYGAGEAGNPAAGLPVTPSQQREMQAAGGFQPLTPLGASANPRYETPFSGAPETGSYVPLKGGMVQTDAEPISKTLLAGMSRLTGTDQWQGQRAPWAQSNTLDALESGAMSGALLGGKNELGAVPEGLLSMIQGEGFGAGFDPALQAADERDRILRENHPLAYYGGGAGGTLATGAVTPTIRAGGAVGKTLGNALIQGGQGAAAGFLGTDGSVPERLRGAVVGGTLGAAGGAVASKVAPPPRRAPIGNPTVLPQGIPMSAAQRAAKYVERQSIPLDELEAFSGNPNMIAAEVMGQRGKRALGGLGVQEGTTPEAFAEMVAQRAEQRPERMKGYFAEITGMSPNEAAGDIDAIIEAGQKSVRPLFDAARANPKPIMSDRLSAIIGTPEGKKAVRQVYADMMNDIDGPRPEAVGFDVTGMTPDGLPESVTIRAPTVEAWDRIYKQIGRQVERDTFGKPLSDSASPANRNIDKLRAALRQDLGKASPEWDAAMAGSADYKSAQSAFDTASKALFQNDLTARKFAEGVAKWKPGERQAAAAGMANAIFERAQKGLLRPNTLKTPAVRDKLRAVLGDDAANRFIAKTEDEARMMQFEQRHGPNANSATADRAAAIKEQNDNPWRDAGVNAVLASPFGPPAMVAAAGSVPLKRIASKMMASKPEAWRDYAGQLLLDTPENAAKAIRGIPRKDSEALRLLRSGAHETLKRGSGRLGGFVGSQ